LGHGSLMAPLDTTTHNIHKQDLLGHIEDR
jgi:hypothetical protein